MDNVTDRERRAEQLANAQIPGYNPAAHDAAPAPAAEAPKRDTIDLSGAPVEPPTDLEIDRITRDVVTALKTVYDPEIPTDIYELGLIYKVELEDDRTLKVDMTLTAPGCPVAGEMPIWVRDACARVEGVRNVEVDMVFDPPWTPDRMSEEARLELNML
jgi:FeS assembly SUF system protein